MKTPLLLLCITWSWAPSLHAAENLFAAEKKADRLVITRLGKPFADFVFNDPQILRPYLANVKNADGLSITRPLPPPPDAADHATMHPGIWLAFGDVCGHDFWRNKGAVKHERFVREPAASEDGLTFSTLSKLVPPQGPPLAEMNTAVTLSNCFGADCLLLWEATITPLVDGFYFGDQEEMGFGLRMAPALAEKQGGLVTSSTGRTTAKDTWGRTAAWCDYSGPSGDGLMIFTAADHFRPSWFHTREYGLMVANPFGKQAFTRSEKPDRTPVEKGRPFRLRFGVALHRDFFSGPGDSGEKLARQFEGLCLRDVLLANIRQRIDALANPELAAGTPPTASWSIEANTFSNCVSGSTIVSLYNETCRKLKQLHGEEVKTWRWTDTAGFPRIETVVERKDGQGKVKDHLVVRFHDNNDNDHFQLSLSKGAFPTNPLMKLQPSWELPKGLF